jgi:hypothetical protein
MSKRVEAIDRVESLARKYFSGSGQFLEQTSPTGKSWAGSDLGEVPSKISRGELLDDGKNLSDIDYQDFFVQVMAWGHGPAGYAAFRTRRVLDRIPVPNNSNSNHLDRWCSRLRAVAGKGPQESFDFLASGEGNVKYLGPAFSTKLLYFLSPPNHRLPILDSLVHQWLWDQGVATNDKPIELDHNDGEGYMSYINFCDDALERLDMTQELGTEHDRGFVEYLMFCDQAMSDATRSLPTWIVKR